MKVVEIRELAEWQRLRPAWESLLRQSASATIFLTWEWVTAWWSAYGNRGELRILTAYDDGGELRGIAPLLFQQARRYGQTVPTLTFIGDGSDDSDYLDFIVAAGYEQRVMEAFSRHWSSELKRGTVLLLNEIPETSPNLAWLRSDAKAQGARWTETPVPCGTVHMPDTWEAYLAMLKPRFRTKVRSVLRNLESRPEIQFGFCRTQEDLQRMLPVLFDLHARRWAKDGKPGVFGRDHKQEFYWALSQQLLACERLRFSWLEWKGRVLACQYGFVYGTTYFHLQEGYEPASDHWNAGIGLRAWCFREFLKEGLREYDSLAGVGRHKTDWGAEVKHSYRVQLADPLHSNLLFCRGPEWEARARESVKSLLPEKILAARRARLEQAPSPNGHAGAGWLQKTIADCYFQCRLPAVVRPLRDRYQLSVSSGGKFPRISLTRRQEASARILIYHRVNNDHDPFFPAISNELFEEEMRFVAGHYKVVSLTDLVNHLEQGSPGTVVAITFDDGYQDNYQNAFPILERHGLPATIFLTTGGLDTGEPLWFEQLALALKKTAKESVDLEVDIPRRFWLRTQAERLESNNGIFAILRCLPDAERRQWLGEILRQLESPDQSERKNKMLTWDQVRQMKARGIDFGGHTVTHPFISKLPKDQVTWEVSECKRRIEEELQLPVHHFAYPNGRDEDFGKWNKELIAGAGYRSAVTTNWGMNYPSTDLLELRRGGPWEESPAMFAYKLDWYQLVDG